MTPRDVETLDFLEALATLGWSPAALARELDVDFGSLA